MIYPILLKPRPDLFAKNPQYTSTFCECHLQNREKLIKLFSQKNQLKPVVLSMCQEVYEYRLSSTKVQKVPEGHRPGG
jgi:hypothetical protein